MPQSRTPSVAEVLAAHLAICLLRFSAVASSPCCRVPIFRSSTHGRRYEDVIFSIIKKSVTNKTTTSVNSIKLLIMIILLFCYRYIMYIATYTAYLNCPCVQYF